MKTNSLSRYESARSDVLQMVLDCEINEEDSQVSSDHSGESEQRLILD